MGTVNKNNNLFRWFLASFILFNVLFFTHGMITDWWYDRIDIYSKCYDNESDTSDIFDLQNCDINSLSKADDIILGAFALSGIASAVMASILLSRKIERTWNKRAERSERNKPRPRRPRSLQ